MWTLSRTFEIEMGHALGKGYKGKCRNIHGHSWKVELAVTGNELDQYDFLVDFGIIKELTKQIDEKYDHVLVLNEDREHLIDENADTKIVWLFENPTSEYFAKMFYQMTKRFLRDRELYPRVNVKEVTIWETSNSKCIYSE